MSQTHIWTKSWRSSQKGEQNQIKRMADCVHIGNSRNMNSNRAEMTTVSYSVCITEAITCSDLDNHAVILYCYSINVCVKPISHTGPKRLEFMDHNKTNIQCPKRDQVVSMP